MPSWFEPLGWTNPPSQSTSTTYDARNSRIQQIDGLTNQVTTYDPDHNYAPKAVYLPTGSGRELQSLFTYDVRHRLTTITHQLRRTCRSSHFFVLPNSVFVPVG